MPSQPCATEDPSCSPSHILSHLFKALRTVDQAALGRTPGLCPGLA